MDTPVIDFHSHASLPNAIDDVVAKYVRIMDAAGVDRSCINTLSPDARGGNDLTASFVARHPDRFVGVAYVTPQYAHEAIPELERAFDELGMKSLKVYPDVGPIDDPVYFPIYGWANDRGIAVMSHTEYFSDERTSSAPRRFAGLAERFPRISWVLGHAGNAPQGQAQAIEVARSYSNVYLETCSSFGDHGTIERLVEGAGEDRVLYGSDMLLMDARLHVGRIATADISDEAKRKVLGLNAIKLLGLDG